ncbi:MAG: prepilin-type N-terminal cleavage/methylation domain-containing protein [Elusimicrobiaceae bacterium]|uniref:type IV pilin protein n=2 Tax=Candidatus Avelusimicrobium faecicola TaxID=3416205 RepID=UPI002A7A866C|nr:prepilin-type N-terminal cleavage/methylation domain-containing protein [Spirochaetota bacterium]MDY2940377.1 prepilin-type N-terminal cleavage/methylation domain-containing protein [Elusimicrobiaceae bacterium]
MSKKQNKNKRAFTLTELLIVVIVIGVLSAVTLPKFTRVIENRKVTEAEEMMSAVRTEQERRCAMDKPYTLKFDNLSDVVSSSNTKNYTYSLQAEGVSATSNKGDYTLKMLSYQDGSFCCTGADCAKLNKNYPSCDGLTFPSSGCEGSDGDGSEIGTDPTPSSSCTDGQVRGSQSCNTCGVQTTQACVGGRWVSQLGECSKTVAECETPECTEGAVSGSQSCNTCGTQTTKKCVSGKWVNFLGACSKTVEECTQSTDCCNMSGSAKNECLKKQYGANSAQYICATGDARKCAEKIYNGGTAPAYCIASGSGGWNENAASDCKTCAEQVPEIVAWAKNGFWNYACNGAPKKCDVKGSGSSDTTGCCRIYEAEEETYSYVNTSSAAYSDCKRVCSASVKCPDYIKPGVYLQASNFGYNCWTSCKCPEPNNHGAFYGKRKPLKCKKEGKPCKKSEITWLK